MRFEVYGVDIYAEVLQIQMFNTASGAYESKSGLKHSFGCNSA